MTDNSGQAAPGWYPDPSGAPRQRYFDGEVWTDNYHGEAMTTGVPAAAQGPLDYWKTVMTKNYANFSGRARRAEYWWSYLINIAILVVLFILTALISEVLVFLPLLFGLAMIVPMIAAAIRRLHDTGKSGWWLLTGLIPFVGGIIQIVLLATDGERGPNQYGPSPKY